MSRQLSTLTRANKAKKKVVVKVGMVGDSQIGKTSLMVKYVEGNFNEDYIQTLGVNFMEKSIALRNSEITFSIWDLGGQAEYLHMLPLVCNDAVALLFLFDLSRRSTLTGMKHWYKQCRLLNPTASPFLIGTKFDCYVQLSVEDQTEIATQARRFARAMKAPLVFCSAKHSIAVAKIFKIVLSSVFDLPCTVPQCSKIGEPLCEYDLPSSQPPSASSGSAAISDANAPTDRSNPSSQPSTPSHGQSVVKQATSGAAS